MFGHLKKKGFDLEATHMTDAGKLEKLFAVLTLAFTYTYAWGCHLRHKGKKSNAAAKRKSLFRLGLEDIISVLQPPEGNKPRPGDLREFLHWLAHSPFDSIFLV